MINELIKYNKKSSFSTDKNQQREQKFETNIQKIRRISSRYFKISLQKMSQQKFYWLHKFRTTKYYFHFSLLQLVLTVILLSCVTLQYEKIVFQLEISIALLLLIDITIRYLTDRQNFFKKFINIIDCIISIMIIGILVIEIFSKFDMQFFFGEVESIVLDIRYGLQIYRIYALYKQARENRQVNHYQDVRLDNNHEVDLNDDIMVDFVSQKTLPKAL